MITNVVPSTPSGPAGGMIAFEVDDIATLTATLRDAGVRLGSAEMIRGPRCRMMPCFDPDGNSLLLHQLDTPR